MLEKSKKYIKIGDDSSGKCIIVPMDRVAFVDGEDGSRKNLEVLAGGMAGTGGKGYFLQIGINDEDAKRVGEALKESGMYYELPDKKFDAVFVVRSSKEPLIGFDERVISSLIKSDDSVYVSTDSEHLKYTADGKITKDAARTALGLVQSFMSEMIEKDNIESCEETLTDSEGRAFEIYVCRRKLRI